MAETRCSWGRFFLLVDLGRDAAVGRLVFLWFLVGFHGFSRFLVGFLGSRLVVMVFHGFDSGLSLTGAVFFQVDLGLGAAVGGMQI